MVVVRFGRKCNGYIRRKSYSIDLLCRLKRLLGSTGLLFYPEDCRVLEGYEEAALAWVDANVVTSAVMPTGQQEGIQTTCKDTETSQDIIVD